MVRASAALIVLFLLTGALTARAEVFYAQDEALKAAFPSADDVTPRTIILTDAQKDEVQRRASVKLDSFLLTLFVGRKEGTVLGYALIDTVEVRTMPATVMTVVSPGGEVQKAIILAFHEPPEYLPPAAWMGRFEQQRDGAALVPGGRIPPIAGSTLSVDAVSGAVRKAVAAVDELVKD